MFDFGCITWQIHAYMEERKEVIKFEYGMESKGVYSIWKREQQKISLDNAVIFHNKTQEQSFSVQGCLDVGPTQAFCS